MRYNEELDTCFHCKIRVSEINFAKRYIILSFLFCDSYPVYRCCAEYKPFLYNGKVKLVETSRRSQFHSSAVLLGLIKEKSFLLKKTQKKKN